jgi:aspartyl-tRNA(Asn)/glutamyl-tRNA(Gln) amidotransferase subunit A
VVTGAGAELRRLSAGEIARAVGAGELDPVDVIEAHAAGLAEIEPLNAIITASAEQALERARGGLSGPLAGVPLIVKDMFDTAGLRTTYGSRIYADHVPERTARAVELLEAAGAVILAKSNLHEFAWGTTSQNPHWGYVENPLMPGHVAGGSSGGNAAALASHVGAIALGTDTGGSIRIPAACCEIAGFKPPHGVVPLAGCMPLSPSFDVAGPMARSVADCVLAYSVLTGGPVPLAPVEGLVAGVLEQPLQMSVHDPGSPPEPLGQRDITADLERLERLGVRLGEGHIEPAAADILLVMLRECADGHAATFPSRREDYGPDTQMKWDAAGAADPVAAAAALDELPRWREAARVSAGVDIFVSPALAGPVPALDVWEPDVRVAMVGHTRTFSFLGWPAIAIGGLQIAGPDAAKVLGAALAYEEAYAVT